MVAPVTSVVQSAARLPILPSCHWLEREREREREREKERKRERESE
jgi:hypothetical protein